MKTLAITISAMMLSAGAPSALGQSTTPTDPDAPGSQQRVEEAQAVLPRVGTVQTPVMPTKQPTSVAAQPGLTQGQDWLKVLHNTLKVPTQPSTLAEGAYILQRKGSLIAGPKGMFIFVPDPETRLPGEGPVLLMPCQTLEQLESEWTNQQIQVSGEIFTYHSRNQLLISDYRLISEHPQIEPELEPETTDQANDDEANDETPSPDLQPIQDDPSSRENDPDVRDLLNELELKSTPTDPSRSSNYNLIESTNNQIGRREQVVLPDAQGGFEEGTLILRRPARLIRNTTGAWTIIFDNDSPDSADSVELIVEPCQMLMRMERIAMQSGDAGRLLVSGRIYTYRGSQFILPSLMQRISAQDIRSIQ